ncbi:methylmalonyl Co-A mutase-associated GTPase MeaB [Nakamurella flava]|uniref:methylmalonyl Co-A mutase-associated GTPase MeaB n=1 Tax=Nakamurella flava TaxID=2576308 RepID=UPI001F1063D8|nr:methylmalonyl Co-A mutase-associated GTPase MeaB [Nakamurella flava]
MSTPVPAADRPTAGGATATDTTRLLTDLQNGSRAALARAITLVESTRADHRAAARDLLAALPEPERPTVRIGISGVPGAGKSTLVEMLGTRLTAAGHRVGVLAVDPSSARTGGSVLGDKTRMPRLAVDPDAYIRPSPTAGTLGGVARATAQTVPVLEAAGFDVVLVETVGVGQSETHVAAMVDTFLLLALARSGDQLQGIKKGVLELADVVAINKADGDRATEARAAARELAGALRLTARGMDEVWTPRVVTCSGLTGDGVDELWATVTAHAAALGPERIRQRRAQQRWALAQALVRDELEDRYRRSPQVLAVRDDVRRDVLDGVLSASAAADALLGAFDAT